MQPPHASFSLRVLIVEDDADTAHTLALLLKLWGYEVAVAYDGPQTLDATLTFHPDVVLLDIALPRMNGYEVARRLRGLPGMEKLLLVAVTGHGFEADLRRSKEAGIERHFLKPVEPAVLREMLSWAGKRRGTPAQLVG